MVFKKGHTPWNKGLSIDDPRVRENIDARNDTMIKKYGTAYPYPTDDISSLETRLMDFNLSGHLEGSN